MLKTPRPLLRGWLHAGASILALVATGLLVGRTWSDAIRAVTMLVFGLSMVELYAVSAVYHVGKWEGRRHSVFRALDHANIFILIAGTYTPICVNVLSGWLRIGVLSVVWVLAVTGVLTTVLGVKLPRWETVSLYLGLGWVALIPLPALLRLLPPEPIALMFLGGAMYSVGAVVYALRRPNPFPTVLGFHEVFHMFVIAGSAAFFAVTWTWVVPYARA